MQLACGDEHTCALMGNGTVRCWGSNYNGELGDGSGEDQNTPVEVDGLSGATQVFAGFHRSCSSHEDQTARCWGFVLTEDGFSSDHFAPIELDFLTNLATMDPGVYHSCSAIADGTVTCLGRNDEGQVIDDPLGFGTPPTIVPSVSGAKLALGTSHSCALDDGDVVCWGGNGYNQLGREFNTGNEPAVVAGLSEVVDLGAGSYHNCAVEADREARCWGYGSSGELGQDISTTSRASAGLVPGVQNAIAIAVGAGHACVVNGNDTVTCWGPDLPAVVPGVSGVVTLAAGGGHTCALLEDGTVACWGLNDSGQLGNGTFDDSATPVTVQF